MVNTEEFIKKLELLLDYYGLNASAFADKIGVQRSSLSHLLSGRNKPSLDFIMKIIDTFSEVDLYWFLLDKGSFPKSENVFLSSENLYHSNVEKSETVEKEIDVPQSKIETFSLSKIISDASHSTSKSTIDKIVIFYQDGTFKKYEPQN